MIEKYVRKPEEKGGKLIDLVVAEERARLAEKEARARRIIPTVAPLQLR